MSLLSVPFLQSATAEVQSIRYDFLFRPPAWVIVLVVIPLAILLATIFYRREKGNLTRGRRLLLGTLRTLTLLAVGITLFRPVREIQNKLVQKPVLLLLVDDSGSMLEKDLYADAKDRARLAEAAGLPGAVAIPQKRRLDLVQAVLGRDQGRLLKRLEERFQLRFASFDASIHRGVLPSDLKGAGLSTRIGDALRATADEYYGQRLAGVVLVSDGRNNDGPDPLGVVQELRDARRRGFAIYSVGVGDPSPRRNLRINIAKPIEDAEFLVNDDVPLQIEVRAEGYEDRREPVTVTVSQDGRDLERREVTLPPKAGVASEVVYVKPSRPGRHVYTAQVAPIPGEQDESDNRVARGIKVINKKIRVLYVEGYPRWEYRYLKNALIRDEDVMEAQCLLLSAEPEFIQEHSKSVRPLVEFPRTPEALFEYDVVIFGDVDPNAIGETREESQKLLANVVRLVEEVGGGFLMIAGEVDAPRSYRGTAIEKILPVTIGSGEEFAGLADDGDQGFRPQRTDAGKTDPVLVVDRDQEENHRLWEGLDDVALPRLYWYYPVRGAKPGATTLLQHPVNPPDRPEKHVILASQFYGLGRTMFLGVDSLWLWRFGIGDRYFYQLYSQAIRFLATTKLYRGNKRYDLFADRRNVSIGDQVGIRAIVKDRNFNPLEADTQEVLVLAPGLDPRPVPHSLKRRKRGEFEKPITLTEQGRWTVRIMEEGSDRVADEITIEADITPIEKENPAMDRVTLEALARESGGTFLLLQDLPDLPDRIPAREETTITSVHPEELWDTWGWLAVVVGLLAAEWILRKTWKLL